VNVSHPDSTLNWYYNQSSIDFFPTESVQYSTFRHSRGTPNAVKKVVDFYARTSLSQRQVEMGTLLGLTERSTRVEIFDFTRRRVCLWSWWDSQWFRISTRLYNVSLTVPEKTYINSICLWGYYTRASIIFFHKRGVDNRGFILAG